MFGEISNNYKESSREVWRWFNQSPTLLKPITFLWVLFASAVTYAIGILFSLGVVFDLISQLVLEQRRAVNRSLQKANDNLRYKKSAYILSPLMAGILAPVGFVLGIFPSWGAIVSSAGADQSPGQDAAHGFFTRLCGYYLSLVKNMFANCFKHGFFFGLIALAITVLIAPYALMIAFMFAILILLDLLSWFVGILRVFVVKSSASLGRNSGRGLITATVFPSLLILLFPIYLILLFIPKVSSQSN